LPTLLLKDDTVTGNQPNNVCGTFTDLGGSTLN
jgi:hypothetical protein